MTNPVGFNNAIVTVGNLTVLGPHRSFPRLLPAFRPPRSMPECKR